MHKSSVSSLYREVRAAFTDIIGADAPGPVQHVLVAISAANLFLLWQWRQTIYVTAADRFYIHWPITRLDLYALAILFCGLAMAFWLLIWLAGRMGAPRNGLALLIVLTVLFVLPLHYVLQVWDITLSTHKAAFLSILAALLALAIVFPAAARTTLLWVFMLTSPFAAFTILGILFASPGEPIAFRKPETVPETTGRRVLWLLFDELDGRVLADHLAEFPSFKALEGQSVVATRAIPAGGSTIRAVPALMLGRRIRAVSPTGYDTMQVTLAEGGRTIDFAAEQTAFGEASRRGASLAISGWQLPYCRLFAGQVRWCHEKLPVSLIDQQSRDIGDALEKWAATLSPLSRRQMGHRIFNASLEDARSLACGPQDLVYVHMPVPHYPRLWRAHDTGAAASAEEVLRTIVGHSDYLHNLHYADEVLGTVIAQLKRCGQWPSTGIIVSADHGLRIATLNYRGVFEGPGGEAGSPGDVPIIVHLPHQESPSVISYPTDSIHIGALMLGMWDGSITAGAHVAAALRLTAPAGSDHPLP